MKVSYTGRRPKDLCGYDRKAYIPLVECVKKLVVMLYDMGYDEHVTGGAQGFDQVVFWAVHSVKTKQGLPLKNIVYVPHKGQEAYWPKNGLFGRDEYNKMLELADDVKIICDNGNPMGKQMLVRNRAMVDDTNRIVALYPDDGWKSGEGGTAYTMRYAYNKIPMIQIKYNEWLTQFTVEDLGVFGPKILFELGKN